MNPDLLNAGLAFLEGFTLILSPCILPILPILLSGSIVGNNKRPYGMIAGFIVFFSLFALFTRKLVLMLGIDIDWLRIFALLFIMFFGVVMVSDSLSEKFAALTSGVARVGAKLFPKKPSNHGFWSAFILGGMVSLIWTPCAGPALAAAIVQTATQRTGWETAFTIFCFALGSALPMFFIVQFSRKLVGTINFLKRHSVGLRRLLGTLIVATAFLLLSTENLIASILPTKKTSVATSSSAKTLKSIHAENLINALDNPYPVPEITNIAEWINSEPLSLKALNGKVVLIDFWTYSCINCIRTLPILREWYKKYHDKGLVIIGVHSPEFEFEKQLENVQGAVLREQIPYPVALDNNFSTWLAFHNRYWPAQYLVNQKGYVVYQAFGEGNENVTENNIRVLLGLNKKSNDMPKPLPFVAARQTPETYFGYRRAERFYGAPEIQKILVQDQDFYYSLPSSLPLDGWALQGRWLIKPQSVTPREVKAELQLHFHAQKVFIVAGNNSSKPAKVNVLLNGEPITAEQSGKDVRDGQLIVNGYRLYEVVKFKKPDEATLRLIPEKTNVTFYSATFG